MKKTRAPKFRAECYAVLRSMPEAGITAEDLVKKVRKTKPEVIDGELQEIIEAGLIKIASETLAKLPNIPAAQSELFQEYRMPTRFSIRRDGKKPIHIDLKDMTVQDARLFLGQHGPRESISKKVLAVARFLKLAEKLKAKPTDRLIDVWERARGSGGGGG